MQEILLFYYFKQMSNINVTRMPVTLCCVCHCFVKMNKREDDSLNFFVTFEENQFSHEFSHLQFMY